ncbi:MAG: hypothetical protein ACKVOI_08970 [Dongiaceae bacterium]
MQSIFVTNVGGVTNTRPVYLPGLAGVQYAHSGFSEKPHVEKPYVVSGQVSEIQTTLVSLDSEKYELTSPILLTIKSVSEGEYIVSFPDAEISRSGESPAAAIAWLKTSLVELYELFRRRQNQLGPVPKRQLKTLERYLAEKPNPKA